MNKRQVWVIKLHASYPFIATVVECRMGETASCRILRLGPKKATSQVKKIKDSDTKTYTVNNYMQVTGIATGENFAFFIYRHFVETL